MVFQLLFKLHAIQYESYQPASNPQGDPYAGQKHDFGAGIACGLTGNNCSVEGSGARGPGPPPLPGHVRAAFLSKSRERGRGSHGSGSLFDISSAQRALRSGGSSSGGSSSGGSSSGGSSGSLPPPHSHGFGSSAYSPAQLSMYSLSGVHVPHGSSSQGGSSDSNTPGSLYGSTTKPTMTNVSQAWGKSVPGAQFHSTASMVPQSSNTSFHFKLHAGVVDATTVEVRGGSSSSSTIGASSSTIGAGSWSWNSAKLMDKDYNLLVKPKVTNVSDAWGKSVPASQFSSASLLPQSANSSFHFGLKNGVIDMSTVAIASNIRQSSGQGSGQSSGQGSGSGAAKGGYSWGKGGRGSDSSGYQNWLIAPEVGQWLPAGMGPFG